MITVLPSYKFQVNENIDIFNTRENLINQNKTSHKCLHLALDIFSTIVFPIGIGRLIVFFAKQIAPLVILPAATTYSFDKKIKEYEKSPTEKLKDEIDKIVFLDNARELFLADKTNNAEQLTIRTADGIDLDTLIINNANQNNFPIDQQKWIVFFQGNGACYENNLTQQKLLSDHTSASILTGNYRGVMRSKGSATSAHDIVLDGEAMVQYLLNKGVPSNNILIHGWSLGGAVATEVASYHQQLGNEMNLCNDRSFSTLSDVVKSMFPNVFGFIISQILFSANWLFESVKNFQKIQGYKFTIHSKEDAVIKYPTSLYKGLKESQMTVIDRQLKALRLEMKAQGINFKRKDSIHYKPNKAIKIVVEISENNKKLSRNEILSKYGTLAHGYPLNEIEEVFELYIKHVKKALRIP
jgi:hypothetical protein